MASQTGGTSAKPASRSAAVREMDDPPMLARRRARTQFPGVSAFMAKVPGHPFWPCRLCSKAEMLRMLDHRKNGEHVLVHFLQAGNYGWVPLSSLKAFEEPPSTGKPRGPGFAKACEMARELQQEEEESSGDELPADMCSECFDGTDEGDLIICEGCEDELHLGCCEPPLSQVPDSEFFCHRCRAAGAGASSDESGSDGESDSEEDGGEGEAKKKGGKKAGKGKKRKPKGGKKGSAAKKRKTGSAAAGKRAAESDDDEGQQGGGGGGRKPNRSAKVTAVADSEDDCFVCGGGGDVILCDAPGCRKVYHRVCLRGRGPAADAESPWHCPRHACSMCFERAGENTVLTTSPARTGEAQAAALAVRVEEDPPFVPRASLPPEGAEGGWSVARGRGAVLVCHGCPLALCGACLPRVVSAKQAAGACGVNESALSFTCPTCASPPPAVALARVLERAWARAASNFLARPFVFPLLPGLDAPAATPRLLCLDDVLVRIRDLRYGTVEQFLRDLRDMHDDVRRVLTVDQGAPGGRLEEAANTLLILARAQLRKHKPAQLQLLEQRALAAGAPSGGMWDVFGPQWWRLAVAGAPAPEPAKTHYQWARLVGAGEVMADTRDSAIVKELKQRTRNAVLLGPTALDPDESLDILSALTNMPDDPALRQLVTAPQTEDVVFLLDQQSLLLRNALQQVAVLKRVWLRSRAEIPDTLDGIITIGEGPVVMELRAANRALRERVRALGGGPAPGPSPLEALSAAAGLSGYGSGGGSSGGGSSGGGSSGGGSPVSAAPVAVSGEGVAAAEPTPMET